MTDLEKAARQALVALEKIASYRPLTFAECSDAESVMGIAEKAIPALREALAEQPAQQVVDSDKKAGAYMEARLWEFIDMAAAWPKTSPDPRTWDHVVVYAPKPAQQEPVAWTPIDQSYPPGGELDILMGDGSILCEVLPQADGDLWWGGASTGERFIDPKYASVTHWRIHAEHTSPPAQRKPLTDDEIESINVRLAGSRDLSRLFARAIEAAHGIKENT